jgi:hypothetical protein
MIVGAVELQVRGGTSRAADRHPVHPAHEAAEGLGGRAVPEDVVSLVVQGRAADLDQAGSVSITVEAQVPKPGQKIVYLSAEISNCVGAA